MKKLVSAVALLCAILLLLPLAVSCAKPDDPAEEQTTAEPVSTEEVQTEPDDDTKYDPHLGSVEWGGRDFRILYNGNELEPNLDFVAEDLNGGLLNDAVYERNAAIQEKHGIKIVSEYQKDSEIMNLVQKSNMAGDGYYQLVEANQNYSMSMALAGELAELSDLENVNTEKPYWSASLLKGSSIAGKNYFAYSDANVHAFGATPCTIFNKKVQQAFALPDIYQLVADGTWTHAAMSEMIQKVTGDLDGDGKITKDDRLGMIANTFCIDCFISGSGYNLILKDDADLPVLNIQNEAFYDIIASITDLLSVEKGMFLVDRTSTATEAREYWTEWAITSDRALFWIGNFKCVERLRTMPTDFGVVPIPKVNENQQNYSIHMQANIGAAMSVPVKVKDIEDISTIIEDIAYQSFLTVMPKYMNVLIEGQLVRDVESLSAIQTIRKAYYCDMGFMLGNFGISILTLMRSTVMEGADCASSLKGSINIYKKKLEDIRKEHS